MNGIFSWIGRIGENQTFIATMAHVFFAYFVVSLASGTHQHIAAVIWLGLFGFKEFFIDRLYEHTPPQTFWDDLDDYIGYVLGIILALTISYYNV